MALNNVCVFSVIIFCGYYQYKMIVESRKLRSKLKLENVDINITYMLLIQVSSSLILIRKICRVFFQSALIGFIEIAKILLVCPYLFDDHQIILLYGIYAFQIHAITPIVDPIVTIFFIKQYRQFILNFFKKYPKIEPSNSVLTFTNQGNNNDRDKRNSLIK